MGILDENGTAVQTSLWILLLDSATTGEHIDSQVFTTIAVTLLVAILVVGSRVVAIVVFWVAWLNSGIAIEWIAATGEKLAITA